MSLWWMTGAYSTTTGASETNYPSLWSGGWTWEDAGSGTGTQGYWQSSENPTDRTGVPQLSVALAGEPVLHTVRRASFGGGKSGWLTQVQPSTASIEVEGEVAADVMSEVVIAVLSTVTDQHSAALWVGYVDDVSRTTDASGHVVTSVSCIDVIGRLGQATVPDDYPSLGYPDSSLADFIEATAAGVGTSLVVEDDSTLAIDSGTVSDYEDGETVLAYLNRVEQADNLNLFALGSGRLAIQRRWYVSSPDLDPAPTPVDLDAAAPPSAWTERLSPTSVLNAWGADFPATPAMTASRLAYGKRASVPPDDNDGWGQMIGTGLLNSPRWLLDSASFPIEDLAHAALFVGPNHWVTLGGRDWQVLSVRHEVNPGHDWTMTLTGDSTQPLLHQEYS